jgi:hypothetical protein
VAHLPSVNSEHWTAQKATSRPPPENQFHGCLLCDCLRANLILNGWELSLRKSMNGRRLHRCLFKIEDAGLWLK